MVNKEGAELGWAQLDVSAYINLGAQKIKLSLANCDYENSYITVKLHVDIEAKKSQGPGEAAMPQAMQKMVE